MLGSLSFRFFCPQGAHKNKTGPEWRIFGHVLHRSKPRGVFKSSFFCAQCCSAEGLNCSLVQNCRFPHSLIVACVQAFQNEKEYYQYYALALLRVASSGFGSHEADSTRELAIGRCWQRTLALFFLRLSKALPFSNMLKPNWFDSNFGPVCILCYIQGERASLFYATPDVFIRKSTWWECYHGLRTFLSESNNDRHNDRFLLPIPVLKDKNLNQLGSTYLLFLFNNCWSAANLIKKNGFNPPLVRNYPSCLNWFSLSLFGNSKLLEETHINFG